MSAENIGELERLFSAEASGRRIALELKDLTLVDEDSVSFLRRCEASGIKVEHCPAYIRQWMKQQEGSYSPRRLRTALGLESDSVFQFIAVKGRKNMKIVVIGGSGRIGSKVVKMLGAQGHQAVAASPDTGVNTITAEGLAEVLKGASVVVDVSDSPVWEDAAVLKFFETSTRNLLTYEAAARVGHHVALSVVGTDRLSGSGYFRGKIAQEKLIKESSVPYSIVHATQFFEFLKKLADISDDGGKVHLPHVLFQPMAADDVASWVCRAAVEPPANGIVEIGGPEQFRLDELVRRYLAVLNDPRDVIADPNALYSGAIVSERTLVPGNNARLGGTRFEDWLKSPASQSPKAKSPSVAAATATKRA